jgi:hypothetical protein
MNLEFDKGMLFTQSPCDVAGHLGEDEAMIGYDLQGIITLYCSRMMCHEPIRTIAVDDLSTTKFDELQVILKGVARGHGF